MKVVGDIVPAGQGSEIFPKVLGFTANDSWCGLGGLVSAIITSYQLYDWLDPAYVLAELLFWTAILLIFLRVEL